MSELLPGRREVQKKPGSVFQYLPSSCFRQPLTKVAETLAELESIFENGCPGRMPIFSKKYFQKSFIQFSSTLTFKFRKKSSTVIFFIEKINPLWCPNGEDRRTFAGKTGSSEENRNCISILTVLISYRQFFYLHRG
jgi:hypothetical protein